MVIANGGQIIEAAHIGPELVPCPVFAHFLMHTVNIAENRLRPDDIFTVHDDLDAQYTVGGRMLWTYIQLKGLMQLALG
jgi:hypothetical protein